jgi:hypothetical protein
MAVEERPDLKRERVGLYVTPYDSRTVMITRADVEALAQFSRARSLPSNPIIEALLRHVSAREVAPA